MKINIKGADYEIKEVEELGNASGITISTEHKIYILKEFYDNTERYKTILHELLHAYLNECGLFRYSNDENLITWLEEHYLPISKQTDLIYSKFKKNE